MAPEKIIVHASNAKTAAELDDLADHARTHGTSDDTYEMWRTITNNPNCPAPLLIEALEHGGTFYAGRNAVLHDNADRTAIQEHLLAHIATGKAITAAELGIIDALANARWTDPATLNAMGRLDIFDSESHLSLQRLRYIAAHQRAPKDLLTHLMHTSSMAAADAAKNRRLPWNDALAIAHTLGWHSNVWFGIARRNDLTGDTATDILTHAKPDVARYVASHPNLAPEVMVDAYFRANTTGHTRKALAERDDFPSDAVSRAVRHPDAEVRRFAIYSPNLTLADLYHLRNDPNSRNRDYASSDAHKANVDKLIARELDIEPDNAAAIEFIKTKTQWWTLTPESLQVRTIKRVTGD